MGDIRSFALSKLYHLSPNENHLIVITC